jgi:thioredoxin-related protein
MKATRVLLLLGTILITATLMLEAGTQSTKPTKPPQKDPNGIEWLGYEAGWEKAKAENKHMFVDFTATWCGWCRRLEQNTFSDARVIKALKDDFIPVKVWEKSPDTLDIDGYRIAEKDLRVKEFRATSFPMLWFVNPKNVRIGPIRGYVDANTLLNAFDIVKNYRYDTTLDASGNPKKKEQP